MINKLQEPLSCNNTHLNKKIKTLRNFIIYLLFLFIFLGSNTNVYASHIMGGEMVYTYIGFNTTTNKHQYNVCLRMYRDGTGISLPGSVNINAYINDGIYAAADFSFVINKSNGTEFVEPPGLAPCGLGIGFQIEIGIYCDTIEVPSTLSGYHLAYESCCRNNDIINLDNPSGAGMTFYTYIPPTYFKNNSPDFTDLAIPYLCADDTTTILNTAYDADGDLLVFSFAKPFDDYTTFKYPLDSVPFAPLYSVENPFGQTGYIDINSSNGLTTYMAPDSGLFVIAVEIKEYRNNVLISVVRRELQFIVITCPVNPAPNLAQISGSGQTVYNIEEGDSISFPIIIYDQDGDSVSMTYDGFVFDSLIINPPAILTNTLKADSLIISQFTWATQCGQANTAPYLFTVQGTDNGCPPKTTNIVYTINVLPFEGAPDTIFGPYTVCANQTAIYNVEASLGSIINWNVLGGTIISGGTSDTITVTWKDTTVGVIRAIETSACTPDTAKQIITIQKQPVAAAGIDSSICLGTKISIGATALPAYTYLWKPSTGLNDSTSSKPFATPNANTEYILYVTSGTGTCNSDTDTVNVLVNSVNITAANDTSLCVGNNLILSVTENSKYKYTWTPGSNMNDSSLAKPVAAPPNSTTYIIAVVDTTTGCIDKDSVYVKVDSLPDANAGLDITICSGDSAQLNASGGNLYKWSPAAGLNDTVIANPFAFPTDTTTYSVNVTNTITGCSKTDTIIVNVISDTVNAFAGLDKSICIGDSIQLLASGGVNYKWFPSAGLSDSSIANPIFKLNTSSTYFVVVSTGSCVTDTDDVTVNVVLPPPANAGNDSEICIEDSVNIGSTGNILYNYTWNPVSGLDNSSIAKPFASPASTTNYTLTVTDSIGCTTQDSVVITVNPKPVIDAGIDESVCLGDSIQLNTTGNNSNVYLWTPVTGLSNPNIKNPKASPILTTTYIVKAIDTNTCVSNDTIIVTVKIDTLIANAGKDSTLCFGESVTLAATGGTKYTWKPALYLSDTAVFNPIAKPDITTTYIVTAASGLCVTDDDTITINVNPLPLANAGIDDNICRFESVIIGAAADPSNAYLWTPSAGLNDSSLSNPLASPYDSTFYILTVSDTNGCSKKDSVIIDVSYPRAEAGPDTTLCIGQSTYIGAASDTFVLYNWLPSAGLDDPTSPFPFATVANTTAFELTTFDFLNGCSNKDTIVINITSLPTTNAGQDTGFCTGDSIVLNASGGQVYSWTPATGLNNTAVASPIAKPANTITYYLTSKDTLTGCVNSDSIKVKVNTLPVADAGGDMNICKSKDTLLNATGGKSYSWTPVTGLSNPSVSNPLASPNSTTKYFVTVTDSNNCKSIDSLTITVFGPAINAGSDITICINQNAQLNAIGDATVVSYLWTPSTGISNANIPNPTATPSDTTNYIVLVKDNTGCENTDTIKVIVVPMIPPNVISNFDSKTICFGDSVELKASSSGVTGYSWVSESNQTDTLSITSNLTVTPAEATNFIVTVTNGICYNKDTVSIDIDSLVVTATGDATICPGENTILQVIGGVSHIWNPGQSLNDSLSTTPIASPQTTTIYEAQGTSALGCIFRDSVTVNVYPIPLLDAGMDTTISKGESVQLNASGSGLYYSWTPVTGLSDTSISNPVASPEVTTTYYVKVTDTDGCINTDSLIVTVEKVSLAVIPSAFSPNGDNVNDFLYVRDILGDGGGFSKLTFIIFNRWGEKVFETNTITSGWDGTKNGKILDLGSYTWILNAKKLSGDEIIQSGTVILAR